MEAANALKDAEPDWFGYSCTLRSRCSVCSRARHGIRLVRKR
jgi:hypothetical protein